MLAEHGLGRPTTRWCAPISYRLLVGESPTVVTARRPHNQSVAQSESCSVERLAWKREPEGAELVSEGGFPPPLRVSSGPSGGPVRSRRTNDSVEGSDLAMWKKLLFAAIVVLALAGCGALFAAIVVLALAGCGASSPAPATVSSGTLLPASTPALASATASSTPLAAATRTPAAAATPTSASAPANTPSLSSTPEPTATPKPTATFTSTPTPAPTSTLPPTDTPSPTNTPLPTNTPIAPTDTPPAGPPPGSEILADGVWRCPSSTAGAAYVGSAQSDKFHYLSCRWAGKIKDENRICFASKSAAVAYGYVACGVCKP